tara:strand:+ start:42 stop:203 length:162 start_codon:yes stop_codon:yes gene_type:complete
MKSHQHQSYSTNNSAKELQIKRQTKVNQRAKPKENHNYQKMLIRLLNEAFPER